MRQNGVTVELTQGTAELTWTANGEEFGGVLTFKNDKQGMQQAVSLTFSDINRLSTTLWKVAGDARESGCKS